MKHFLKKGDIVILVCALVISALLFLPRLFSKQGDMVAKVYENGKLTHEIELKSVAESYELEINGASLLVETDGVTYVQADCKDKICIKSGKLKNAGDTAACVPNKTVVTLVAEKEKIKADIVTY